MPMVHRTRRTSITVWQVVVTLVVAMARCECRWLVAQICDRGLPTYIIYDYSQGSTTATAATTRSALEGPGSTPASSLRCRCHTLCFLLESQGATTRFASEGPERHTRVFQTEQSHNNFTSVVGIRCRKEQNTDVTGAVTTTHQEVL
jgi:hypothetical protein